jgi:hypothetical protein
MIAATLTAVGMEKQQKGLSSGALLLNIPFLYPYSIPSFIRVCGNCQADRESLSYPVIDF